jgi:hypothetical protein
VWSVVESHVLDVEAEEAGRVELSETAEEGAVRDVPWPAFADKGGADKGGGEAYAEENLDEEIAAVEHLGYGCRHSRRRCWMRVAFHVHGFEKGTTIGRQL